MTSHRLVAFGLAATVFLLDRVTKGIIRSHVSPWDTYVVIPGFFHIVHTENRGAAFGLLANSDSEWRTFFLVGLSILVLALVASVMWQPSSPSHSRALGAGLSLLFGGALGNLYDRITHGTVTDFLEFFIGQYHWPAFNVADSAITVGAGLLLLDLWLSRRINRGHAKGAES
jgi:signal peptidase II